MFLQNKKYHRFELNKTELEVGHFIRNNPRCVLIADSEDSYCMLHVCSSLHKIYSICPIKA